MAAAPLLVTGGRGFLGRRVVRLAAAAGIDVVAPGPARSSTSWTSRPSSGAYDRSARLRSPTSPIASMSGTRSSTVPRAWRDSRRRSVPASCTFRRMSSSPGGQSRTARPTHPHRCTPTAAAKADAERVVAELDPGAVLVRTSLLYAADPHDPGAPVEAVRHAPSRTLLRPCSSRTRCAAPHSSTTLPQGSSRCAAIARSPA